MKILYLPNNLSQQRQFEKKNVCIYPIQMAMEATYYKNRGDEVLWDEPLNPEYNNSDIKIITEPEGLDFLSLPKPDRIFTNAMDKKYQQNGNFKYLPGTYIMSASGCSHGKCSFCVEKDKPYLVRPIESVIEEINECKALGFKEVFDDSATFPTGDWLECFCRKIMENKPNIKFSCNARISPIDFQLLANSGFRMLLFGVESANQQTLDYINKGVKVEDIIPTIKKASEAGLEPHVAVMFGYPWESDNDSINTLRLVHYLLRKGYAKTAQASFYTTQEGNSKESARKFVKKVYEAAFYPGFWFNKIKDIHNVDDLKYLWRSIKKGLNDRCNSH